MFIFANKSLMMISHFPVWRTSCARQYTSVILATLFLLVFSSVTVSAQRQRNYIYIFDCTASMKSPEINMWEPAKNALDKTVTRQSHDPESRFVIVPFQDNPFNEIVFDGSEYEKKRAGILERLDKIISTPHSKTNIYEAFKAGMRNVNPAMDNRVYLLTDGEDVVHGTPAVCRLIREWCAAHKNTQFFYVMLDGVATNPALDEALAGCSDAYSIKCTDGEIPTISDIGNVIYANTLELNKTYSIGFSEKEPYPVEAKCADRFFNVSVEGGKSSDYNINVRFSPRGDISVEELNNRLAEETDEDGMYEFTFTVNSKDPHMTIVNPEVTVIMANRAMRKLSLLGGDTDEVIVKPGAEWYPAFLWSDAAPQEEIVIDLAAKFTNTDNDHPMAVLAVVPANGDPSDFKASFNGQPIGPGETFIVEPGKEARLGITFDTDAETGKRYFSLVNRDSRDIEMLNGVSIGAVSELPFRTTYSVNWNPLKTLLVWIGIVLLSVLILWFLFIKRMVYPTFKSLTIQMQGPGSYFATKRLRGARKAVLTSRRESQNIFSRIFTGKIIYIRADHFTPAIELLPARNAARMTRNSIWDIAPTARLEKGNEYTLTNNNTGDKTYLSV